MKEVRGSIYFFGLILISVFFVAYYAIHAIITVNVMELIVFRVLTVRRGSGPNNLSRSHNSFFLPAPVRQVWLCIRVIIGFAQSSDDCRVGEAHSMCLGFMIVEVCFNIFTTLLSISALDDLKWRRYKAVGPEVKVRAVYMRYELFSVFRKIDLQFSIVTLYTGVLYTATNLATNRTAQFAFGANIALIFIEIAWDYFAKAAVRLADPYYMYSFWVLSIFLPVFICSLMWDYFAQNDNVFGTATLEVLVTVAVFSLLAIVNRVGTVICSVMLYGQFESPQYPALQRMLSGSRLKEFHRGRQREPPEKKVVAKNGVGLSGPDITLPNPMSVLQTAGQPSIVALPTSPLDAEDLEWEVPYDQGYADTAYRDEEHDAQDLDGLEMTQVAPWK